VSGRRLLVYQAVWAMEGVPGIDLDADMGRALEMIAEAGFDGVGVNILRPARAEPVARRMPELGLTWEAMAAVRRPEEVVTLSALASVMGAHHLNLQVLERTAHIEHAVALLGDMQAAAAGAPLPVYFETHRGRLTNDLLFMMRVLDALPDLRLTGDLSHYPVVHEFPLPVPPEDQARIGRILDHCWAFHGRVSGSHQVQLPIFAPQHQPWVEQFRAWWRQGFASWAARAPGDADLTFLCELGPPHYAMTDGAGRELSDRWAEAQRLMAMARELWAEVAP
jgi:hypothetical protein